MTENHILLGMGEKFFFGFEDRHGIVKPVRNKSGAVTLHFNYPMDWQENIDIESVPEAYRSNLKIYSIRITEAEKSKQ